MEEDFPADWGDHDDIQEIIDENGWNLLHYSILKGFSNAVTVLVEEQGFGKSLFLHADSFRIIPILWQLCKKRFYNRESS